MPLLSLITDNPSFDQRDLPAVQRYFQLLSYWSRDVQSLIDLQIELESLAIYFSEKYMKRSKLATSGRERVVLSRKKYYRDTDKLKGEGLDTALVGDQDATLAKKNEIAAVELFGVFDKLHWTVIRKESRIHTQDTLNQKTGGGR